MASMQSHSLKLEQAAAHLKQLELEIFAWFDKDKHRTLSIEPDPNVPLHQCLKISADDIPVAPFSLIIGDVVQNIRSALDHVVYALANAYTETLSEKAARDSQFPIIGDEGQNGATGLGASNFQSIRQRRIGCIDPKAQAIIERVQPYHRGAIFRGHYLWKLNELSNIDKHRSVHLGAALTRDVIIRHCIITDAPGGKAALEMLRSGVIKGSAIVARFGSIRPKDPAQTVEMNVGAVMDMAFDGEPMHNLFVVPALAQILNYVALQIISPLEQFL
jgi:hypothetical protein